MSSDAMENLYRVGQWVDGPGTEQGKARYADAATQMRSLLSHPWIAELAREGEARILDLCGGWGVAGVALSKTLKARGVETKLTVLDLRRDMETPAKALGESELGEQPRFQVGDATRLDAFEEPFDIVLLWGASAMHFDPWEMTRMLQGVSLNMTNRGVFLAEETDKPQTILLQGGYQRTLVEEASEEKAVISLHSGYDPRRGVFRRLHVDLMGGRSASESVYFWGFAGLAQAAWMFFMDVDLAPRERGRGILLASRPRRAFKAGAFDEDPAILRGTP